MLASTGGIAGLVLVLLLMEAAGRGGWLGADGTVDPVRILPAAREYAGGILGEPPERYVTDGELGYVPVAGTGRYSDWGTLKNRYEFAKRPGVRRMLFIGDSVLYLEDLPRAIEDVAGVGAEIWNGGVRGYNTIQEVDYFRRCLRRLDPDHVVLVFHNNDFRHTPVAFRDDTGHVRAFGPSRPSGIPFWPWLFTRSWLYQRWVLRRAFAGQPDRSAIVDEVRRSLVELEGLAEEDGFTLSVLILPVFKPVEEWSEEERWSRAKSLAIMQELKLHHFDLLPALEASLAAGETVSRAPGDDHHPSPELSRRMAEILVTSPGLNAPHSP